MTTRAADDIGEIDTRLQTLKYERCVSIHVAQCAAVHGGTKSSCDQCKDAGRCLVCKTRMPGNQSGAHGCFICDLKGGTTFEACPT
jgi:hypothetical protein